jgi:hypothetical protein
MTKAEKTLRGNFTEGYNQAEKDLELTWEDMRELHIIFETVNVEIELGQSKIMGETLGYYEEILRRFNIRKQGGSKVLRCGK